MKRGLVTAQMHVDIFVGKAFPKVYDIALICERHGFPAGHCTAYACHKFGKVLMHLIHPSLGVALLCGGRVDFRNNTDHAGDVAGLRLCA